MEKKLFAQLLESSRKMKEIVDEERAASRKFVVDAAKAQNVPNALSSN